jgi:hypothetical protein
MSELGEFERRAMLIKMPLDVKKWIERRAIRDVTTQQGIVVRALRDLMEAEWRERTGVWQKRA